MKTVYFIRHGEADHNIGFSKFGESAYYSKKYVNSSLTRNGKKQCQKVLNKQLDVEYVYTSPLKRTLQTTEIIFGKSNIPIIVLDELRECNYDHPCNGRKTKQQIQEQFPEYNTKNLCEYDEWFVKGDPYNRCEKLTQYIKTCPASKIAVISHASFLRHYLGTIGWTQDKEIQNCDVICIKL